MLRPTIETLGAWDYFKLNKLIDVTKINCHKRINENFFERDPKNRKHGSKLPIRRNFYKFKRSYKVDDTKSTLAGYEYFNLSIIYNGPTADDHAKSDKSDFETVYQRKSNIL